MNVAEMQSQTVTTEYNGWSNYETWVVDLWLNESEGSRYILEKALRQPYMQDWESGEWLRSMLSYQLYDEIDEPCMWQDLLLRAFGKVNWTEIIQNNQE